MADVMSKTLTRISELTVHVIRGVSDVLILLASAAPSIPSSSVNNTMLRLLVVVCTVGYLTLFSSQTAWTQPLETNATPVNHRPGLCSPVTGIDGDSGDIQALPNGLAFISSGKHPKTRGKIFLFDFKKSRYGARALYILGYFDQVAFSPQGLNLWIDIRRNLVYVFVVNHNVNNKETVEKFLFDGKRRRLYHMKTYHDPAFIHLGDIVATGKESFYFSNYFQFDLNWEIRRRLRVGNVGFYDGTRGRTVKNGLGIPIGITTSPDGRYLYMAELGGESLSIYARKSDNTLSLVQVVPLSSLVDKVDVDVATGDVWVAGHGDTDFLLNNLIPPMNTTASSSQVFRLTMSDSGSMMIGVEDVYYNDGQELSGSTVAVHYRKHILIGSISAKLLLCEVRRA